LERVFPNITASLPIALLQAPGDYDRYFLVEKRGRVRMWSGTNPSASNTFVDISSVVSASANEAGLLGMAFHPRWPAVPQVFLSYTTSSATAGSRMRSVVARFVSSDGGRTLSATPEELISVDQPYSNHNGGGIAFGQDGLLYLSLGDGGSAGDPQNVSQNTNSLLGKMLRIDVDRGSPYAIPNDNPFAQGGGRGEVFAYGLRNVWRFSFDRATGELWGGDVGQNAFEEINLITRGGNFGWRVREGFVCYNATSCTSAGMVNPIAVYGRSDGVSVTGGYVYRGTAIPWLVGTYLYGDFSSGKMWGLSRDPQTGGYTTRLLLETGTSIASFAEDNGGELYVLDYGQGRILRIVQSGATTGGPARKLSQTGCFDAANPTEPGTGSGLIPYSVQSALWSDGSEKVRHFAVPNSTTIAVGADGDFDLPIGSVTSKTFYLGGKPIETRLFVRHLDGGWAGYSYEWEEDGSDALLLETGKSKRIGNQTWQYPSRSQCMQCHTGAAGFTLGLELAQLNGDQRYPTGRIANQVATLNHIGMFESPLPTSASLPRMPSPFGTEPLVERAKAYLHSNCAGCHRPGAVGGGSADYRFATPLAEMGVCNVQTAEGNVVVAPGNHAQSEMFRRLVSTESSRMPPLGTTIADARGAEVVAAWIDGLNSCR
jgi:uncharacterized repeat protein (TIGR03806 family)